MPHTITSKNYSLISSSNYIKWVQRSLNIAFDANLKVDGIGYDPKFNRAVREFRLVMGLSEYPGVPFERFPERYVDAKLQDKLIEALEWDVHGVYSPWVRKALDVCGIIVHPGAILPMRSEVRVFQGLVPGLLRDGYVGAKTDLALFELSGVAHPGRRR